MGKKNRRRVTQREKVRLCNQSKTAMPTESSTSTTHQAEAETTTTAASTSQPSNCLGFTLGSQQSKIGEESCSTPQGSIIKDQFETRKGTSAYSPPPPPPPRQPTRRKRTTTAAASQPTSRTTTTTNTPSVFNFDDFKDGQHPSNQSNKASRLSVSSKTTAQGQSNHRSVEESAIVAHPWERMTEFFRLSRCYHTVKNINPTTLDGTNTVISTYIDYLVQYRGSSDWIPRYTTFGCQTVQSGSDHYPMVYIVPQMVDYWMDPNRSKLINEGLIRSIFSFMVFVIMQKNTFSFQWKHIACDLFVCTVFLYGHLQCGGSIKEAALAYIGFCCDMAVEDDLIGLDSEIVTFGRMACALFEPIMTNGYFGMLFTVAQLAPCLCLQHELREEYWEGATGQPRKDGRVRQQQVPQRGLERFCFECETCGKMEATPCEFKSCKGCRVALYCCRNHKREDWDCKGFGSTLLHSHKIPCQGIQKFLQMFDGIGDPWFVNK